MYTDHRILVYVVIRLILIALPALQLNFEPYTTGIPYVYSSLPMHNELQIWEFNKSIMKLQGIFNEKDSLFKNHTMPTVIYMSVKIMN